MKNTFFKIALLLLICIITLPMLVGCPDNRHPPRNPGGSTPTPGPGPSPSGGKSFSELTEVEQALYIFNIDTSNLPDVISYTATSTLTFSGVIEGVHLNMIQNETTYIAGMDSADRFVYCVSGEEYSTMSMSGQTKVISTTYKNGYADGRMYRYFSDGAFESALCSPITVDEFEAHKADISASIEGDASDITADSCETITCVRETNGSYTATFTGFSEESMVFFKELTDQFATAFNVEIVDVELVMCVSADLRPAALSFYFVFGDKGPTPYFTAEVLYSDYNETVPPAVDFSLFTETDDLRAAELAETAINDAKRSEYLQFDYNASTVIKQGSSTIGASSERYEITVDTTSGYTYDIAGEIDGEEYVLWYENGTQFVLLPGQVDPVELESSDMEARELVGYQIDPGSFDIDKIVTSEIQSGKYVFEIADPDISSYDAILSALDATRNDVTGVEAKVTISMNGFEIQSYKYEITLHVKKFMAQFTVTTTASAYGFSYIKMS